jgi:hypothetical protein
VGQRRGFRPGARGASPADRRAPPPRTVWPVTIEVASSDAKFLEQVRAVIEIHLAEAESGVEALARLLALTKYG